MNLMGRLTVTTYCTNCDDFVVGLPVGDNTDRCTECGCYASGDDVCCTQHEVRSSPYPSGVCPYCEEEQRIRGERMHQATRDPQVEPW